MLSVSPCNDKGSGVSFQKPIVVIRLHLHLGQVNQFLLKPSLADRYRRSECYCKVTCGLPVSPVRSPRGGVWRRRPSPRGPVVNKCEKEGLLLPAKCVGSRFTGWDVGEERGINKQPRNNVQQTLA